MQQYYYHHSLLPGGKRSHPRHAKLRQQTYLALVNHNALEFYQQHPHGLTLHTRHPFPVNIAALLILPSLHHDSDYFLIIDPQARWFLWQGTSPLSKSEQTYESSRNELYGNPAEEFQVQCGQKHSFDVHDTKGKVFLSVGGVIIVMQYAISRQGIKLGEPVRNDNPYLKYRQVGWVGEQIGIVEEQEEKTFLHLHHLDAAKINSKPAYSKEYVNLREFKSIKQHLLIRTDSSVVLLTDKHVPLATHPVQDPDGRLVELGEGIYGYFGYELLIFDQKKIVSFGGLSYMGRNLLEGRGILEVQLLKQEKDGGKLVAITTLTHQVILVVLYDNRWKLYHRLAGNTPTFSVHPTPNPHVLLAVTSSTIDHYRLVAIETHRSLPHTRTLAFPSPLQNLQILASGKFVLVSSQNANLLLRFDSQSQEYCQWLTLPFESILTITDSHLATERGLYALNLQDQLVQQLSADEFVLATAGPAGILTLNSKGEVALLTPTSICSVLIRQNAQHEYCWSLNQNGNTIVACLSDLQHLKVISGKGQCKEVELREHSLVSALREIGENILAVGYVNGKLHVYKEDQLVAQFDHHSSQPIRFFLAGQNRLGVATPDQQFLLTALGSTFRLDKLQLSTQGRLLSAVAYLPLTDEFMMAELGQGQQTAHLVSGASVGISSAPSACEQGSYRMRVLSQDREDIPVVMVVGTIAYVGLKQCVRAYDWKSGDLLAQRKNFLRDVIGIQLMQSGILVYGIDQLQRNILLVLEERDLELKATINLIQKDSKYIKAIEVIPGTDKFLCRGDRFTTLYELSDIQEPTVIHELKTELPGFSLSVGPETIFAETDSYRLVVLYTYDPSLLPIARHLSDHEVVDVALLSRCMLTGNRAGYISVHEYNFQNQNEALRMNLTQVGHMKISEEVTGLSAVSSTRAFYGCLSGAVGSMSLITQQQFEVLSKAERAGLQELTKEGHLSYQGWRKRKGETDKLIDSTLIRVFIAARKGKDLSSDEREQYQQVRGLFQMLSM